jgi:hypothetical protein
VKNCPHCGGLVGHRSHQRRLTDEQVRAIRADRRPLHKLAEEYGLSKAAIFNAREGINYKDVTQ